jgi:hypothetical protein
VGIVLAVERCFLIPKLSVSDNCDIVSRATFCPPATCYYYSAPLLLGSFTGQERVSKRQSSSVRRESY